MYVLYFQQNIWDLETLRWMNSEWKNVIKVLWNSNYSINLSWPVKKRYWLRLILKCESVSVLSREFHLHSALFSFPVPDLLHHQASLIHNFQVPFLTLCPSFLRGFIYRSLLPDPLCSVSTHHLVSTFSEMNNVSDIILIDFLK